MRSLISIFDESGRTQCAKMLRDGGLAEPEWFGKFAGRPFLDSKHVKNPPPNRMRDRAKNIGCIEWSSHKKDYDE